MKKIKRFLVLLSGILFLFTSSPVSAFDNTPPITSAILSGTVGSNSWYTTTVDVTLTASDSQSGVGSTEYWLDTDPHNIINFLPNSPTTVQFNVSSSGTHTISYFSTNKDGVAESTKSTAPFKIDTSSPFNWENFGSATAGNSHTYKLNISVDDSTSGLDPDSAYYNYTVDGINYGYYTNTTQCNSGFNTEDPDKKPDGAGSGWKKVPTISPNSAGSLTMTLTTDSIDFCNSSWDLTEALQFYIKDLAGNESYKIQLLFGPWMQTSGGDLHSQGDISFSAQGASDYLVSSKGSINNMTSNQNWYTAGYDLASAAVSYNALYVKLGSPGTALPNGKLPKVKGSYFVNGDYTIDSGTIPSGLSTTKNFGAVVFVKGTLTINQNYSLDPSAGIVFVTRDGISSDKGVNSFAGFFITDGKVDLGYNGNNSTQLVITGSLVGNSAWHFGKNLGGAANIGSASEKINFQPSYLSNKDLVDLLTVNPTYSWTEVAP